MAMCTDCMGDGYIICPECSGKDSNCPECDGKGRVVCGICDGSGYVSDDE